MHRHYEADWILKLEDDVYLSPSRLLAATSQWSAAGAQYVGCMNHGLPIKQLQAKDTRRDLNFHIGSSSKLLGSAGAAAAGNVDESFDGSGVESQQQRLWFWGVNNTIHAAPSIYALADSVVGAILEPNSGMLRDLTDEGSCCDPPPSCSEP